VSDAAASLAASIWDCQASSADDDAVPVEEGGEGEDGEEEEGGEPGPPVADCDAEIAACEATAVDAYDALKACIKGNCPPSIGGGAPSQECTLDQIEFGGTCKDLADACVTKTGGSTYCTNAVACMADCGWNDYSCFEGCLDSTSLEGQVLASQYHACVQGNCELPYTEACLQKAKDQSCSTLWSSCQNEQF
jgi:hypothetical protein